MRVVLFVALLILSCAPQKAFLWKEVKPIYLMPAKGSPLLSGRGLFIKTRCGEYVRSVASGKVVYAGRDIGSYGWIIIVQQEDGFTSVYGRLSKRWVRAGERVRERQIIGEAGESRGVCGVYYELRNSVGDPVAPVLR